MQSSATTVAAYLQELPAERRQFMAALRQVISDSIDPRFVETMQYGMITWVIPKDIYPPGYHCKPADCVPFLSLASQKNAVSIYLMNVYYDKSLETRLRQGWQAAGLRLDLGKACLRVRQLSETALPVLAEVVAATTLDSYLEHYIGVLSKGRKSAAKQQPGKPKAVQQAAKKAVKKAVKKAAKKAAKKAEKKAVKKRSAGRPTA